MDTSNIVGFVSREAPSDTLTDLLRTGAQRLIASAGSWIKLPNRKHLAKPL